MMSKPHADLKSASSLHIFSISFGENCFHSALCWSCAKLSPSTTSESAGRSERSSPSDGAEAGLPPGSAFLSAVLSAAGWSADFLSSFFLQAAVPRPTTAIATSQPLRMRTIEISLWRDAPLMSDAGAYNTAEETRHAV